MWAPGPRCHLGLLALALKPPKRYPESVRKTFSLFSAAMLALMAFTVSAKAQNSSLGKTFSLIPNDEAWGDVVQKTQPCSVPGEASCAQFNVKDKSLTPLQSFSAQSDVVATPNQNDPSKSANALAPALTSLAHVKVKRALQSPETVSRAAFKNPPAIHGGNGTFITLPSGVQRVNQTTRKTLKSLSKDNGQ